MKVCLISDTHSLHDQVTIPECDLLLHSGDFCDSGTAPELESFARWYAKQPAKVKVCIAGNHDWIAQHQPGFTKTLFRDKGIVYLEDDEYSFYYPGIADNPITIYGSPWQPEFCNWAFNLPRDGDRLAARWKAIPDYTDIILTHGPCHSILDYVKWDNENVGCKMLLDRVLQIKPKIHLCGHIHQAYGIKEFNGTTFVNASTCNEQYKPINQPIIVEL